MEENSGRSIGAEARSWTWPQDGETRVEMLAALCPVVLGCKDIERILTTAGDPPRAVVSAVATLRFGLDLVRRALLGQAVEPAASEARAHCAEVALDIADFGLERCAQVLAGETSDGATGQE